ncbi:hypothetical protein PtrSN002B_012175, partial [Pyrenophora tritici-repentis]
GRAVGVVKNPLARSTLEYADATKEHKLPRGRKRALEEDSEDIGWGSGAQRTVLGRIVADAMNKWRCLRSASSREVVCAQQVLEARLEKASFDFAQIIAGTRVVEGLDESSGCDSAPTASWNLEQRCTPYYMDSSPAGDMPGVLGDNRMDPYGLGTDGSEFPCWSATPGDGMELQSFSFDGPTDEVDASAPSAALSQDLMDLFGECAFVLDDPVYVWS